MIVSELKSILIDLDPKYDGLRVVFPVHNLATDKTDSIANLKAKA